MAPFKNSFAASNSLYPSNWPANPFHEGEVAVQKRLGTHKDVMTFAPRFVRPYMPDEHRSFFENQPALIVAARDHRGRMWSTLLATNNNSSMTVSPDPKTLRIDAKPVKGDALENEFTKGMDVGVLGVEFSTKRRNRVNGRLVAAPSSGALIFRVDQSFGNCPQYIKPRRWWVATDRNSQVAEEEERGGEGYSCPSTTRSDRLSPSQIELISSAETVFVATGYRNESDSTNDPRYGNDSSHRGGPPGFVQVVNPTTLILPDFPGNQMYNTIGNVQMDPRIGITFPQFELGSMVQISGRGRVEFDPSRAAAVNAAAERLIVVEIDEVVHVLEGSLPMRWSHDVAELRERELVVSARIQESDDVMSFLLRPQDHELQSLWSFTPGQHLPIRLSIDPFKRDSKLERTYSISCGPEWGEYRISVKRQGRMSSFLHDRVRIGDVLQVQKPAGDFVLNDDSQRPLLLLSIGIGITPLISMLHHVVSTYLDHRRPVIWVHGARNSRYHTFAHEVGEIRNLVSNYKDALTTHVAYSQPLANDINYDSKGRLTIEKLQDIVPNLASFDVYMCGSSAFIADMEEGLTSRVGVPPSQIHYETF